MQFDLSFDESIIEFTSISPGPFLSSNETQISIGGPSSTTEGLIDNYGITRVGKTVGGVSGNGTLAKIKFQALSTGVSPLGLSGIIVFNKTITPQDHSIQNSSVAVF